MPLLYLREGVNLIVVASFGGRPNHPDWYLNLVANPKAEVQIRRRRQVVTTRVGTSDERSRWWPRIIEAYEGYNQYQSRTDRLIPVVFLEPIR